MDPSYTAQLFTTSEVMARTGAGFQQLHRWCRRGWIPGMEAMAGSGNDRVWSQEALDVARGLVAAARVHKLEFPTLADFIKRAAEAGVKP